MGWLKSLVKRIYDALFPSTLAPPQKLGEMEATELYGILRGVFPQGHIYLGDARYDLTSNEEMDRFFEWSEVPYNPYGWDDLDCEKFAIMQQAEFYRWSSGKMPLLRIIGFDTEHRIPTHGWNLFVDDQKELRYHDPLGLVCNPDTSVPAFPLEYVETIS